MARRSMDRIRTAVALVALALIGCNAILGNDNFRGPGGVSDAPTVDACSGIGCMVANCASRGMPPTSVSGTVYAPDGTLPIYNAVVYVPTAPLDPIVDGPASPACASGAPAVLTRTDASGRFKLDNVPSVPSLPLVIQVGKWRREITVSGVDECADLPLATSETRLPRNASEGHLPRVAVTTGSVECLECMLRGTGFADSEFTTGLGSGRIHLYAEPTAFIQQIGTATIESADTLHGRMMQYDMLLFSCDGQPFKRTPPVLQALLDYVNAGGWVWLTHLQAPWIAPPTPFPAFAQFDLAPAAPQPPPEVMARIDTTTPRGQLFADWMSRVGATSSAGVITVSAMNSRRTCVSVDPAMAQRHIFLDPAISAGFSGVQLFSWSPGSRGKLVYSDMHLEAPNTTTITFPGECLLAPLSAQGQALAFQLFDQPTCVP